MVNFGAGEPDLVTWSPLNSSAGFLPALGTHRWPERSKVTPPGELMAVPERTTLGSQVVQGPEGRPLRETGGGPDAFHAATWAFGNSATVLMAEFPTQMSLERSKVGPHGAFMPFEEFTDRPDWASAALLYSNRFPLLGGHPQVAGGVKGKSGRPVEPSSDDGLRTGASGGAGAENGDGTRPCPDRLPGRERCGRSSPATT
jgi:hypothetical protein